MSEVESKNQEMAGGRLGQIGHGIKCRLCGATHKTSGFCSNCENKYYKERVGRIQRIQDSIHNIAEHDREYHRRMRINA